MNTTTEKEIDVKKVMMMIAVVALVATAVFANGNAERVSTVEGNVALMSEAGQQTQLMLRTRTGEEFLIDVPTGEMAQLQQRLELQNQMTVRVSGVLVDPPAGQQTQTRLMLRTMAANGNDYQVEEPVRLTQQERTRVRLYQEDGTGTQTRTESQTGSSSSGSGSAGSSMKK